MHAVISLLLQSRKFWWYLLLTSSMLLHDVIMTSYCCQRYAVSDINFAFQQDSALRARHTRNSWTAASRNARLSCAQPMASKQPRSQSCGLRYLDCHVASCLPQTNPQCRWIETAAHRGLEQLIFDQVIDQWRGRHRACVRAKGGHFEYNQSINQFICELTMLTLSISVTFNVTCLAVTSFFKQRNYASNVGQFVLVHCIWRTSRFEVW